MTSKTISMFPPSAYIGFEHILNELNNITSNANSHYPPHNVLKLSDSNHLIEIAVAGFSIDEISIEVKDRSLVITGDHVTKGREFIHKGISTKNFSKSFRLSEHVRVTEADLKNGILAIMLESIVPEDMCSRKIKINGNEK